MSEWNTINVIVDLKPLLLPTREFPGSNACNNNNHHPQNPWWFYSIPPSTCRIKPQITSRLLLLHFIEHIPFRVKKCDVITDMTWLRTQHVRTFPDPRAVKANRKWNLVSREFFSRYLNIQNPFRFRSDSGKPTLPSNRAWRHTPNPLHQFPEPAKTEFTLGGCI